MSWNAAWRRRCNAPRWAWIVTGLLALALPAMADVASTQARWKALQAQESAFLAPRRHREAQAAMTALDAAQAQGAAAVDAALVVAERQLNVLDTALGHARSVWADLLRLRAEARDAGAPTLAVRDWTAAENILFSAAQKLETESIDPAKRQAQQARPLYESARYAAWRATMLQGADSTIAWLEAQKARVYVPRSWVRARDARSAAEKLLAQRGKLDDDVRDAGARAGYEARHARFLFDRIRGACDQKAPDQLESSILDWEESTSRALVALGLSGGFDAGLSAPLETIEKEAKRRGGQAARVDVATPKRTGDSDSLAATLADLRVQVHDRDLQIAELQKVASEQDTWTRIQAMFRRDEGRVLLDGRDVVLRLHGLQFAPGKSELPAGAEALLDKVVQLVAEVPGARLVVEGHTEASGKPEANQELSQQRAEAVRAYVASHAGLPPARTTAIGYGGSRPVASNDTEEGRTLNRRIEIILARPQ